MTYNSDTGRGIYTYFKYILMNVILSNLMHVLLVLLLLLLIGSLWNPYDWSHNSISPSIILAYAY